MSLNGLSVIAAAYKKNILARPRQLASEVAPRPTGPHHHNAHRAILSDLRPAAPVEAPTAQHGIIGPRSCAQITQRPAIRHLRKVSVIRLNCSGVARPIANPPSRARYLSAASTPPLSR